MTKRVLGAGLEDPPVGVDGVTGLLSIRWYLSSVAASSYSVATHRFGNQLQKLITDTSVNYC